MMKNIIKKNSRGISEIISYVILVTITLSISVGIYAWLKYQVPNCDEKDTDCFSPVDCPDGTSVMINDYICDSRGLNITVVNNGRFNISGVILAVTGDPGGIPNDYLYPISSPPDGSKTSAAGEFIFQNPLNPGNERNIRFTNKNKKGQLMSSIAKIKMQIFIGGKNRKICSNNILRETLKDCNIE